MTDEESAEKYARPSVESDETTWAALQYSAFLAGCAKVRVELGPDIERLRMQLAACGVAAMCNTKESTGTQRIGKDNPYWCASYGDVCNAVDREIALREENAALREALEWIRGPHQSKSGEDYTDLEFDMVMKAERTLSQPKKSPSQCVPSKGVGNE